MISDDARFDELINRLKASGVGKSVSASEWQEVEDFLIENLKTEEWSMKEYLCGKAHGEEEATEKIKQSLLKIAADHFTSGRDREAEQLRSIANAIPKAARSGERK